MNGYMSLHNTIVIVFGISALVIVNIFGTVDPALTNIIMGVIGFGTGKAIKNRRKK